MSGRTVLHIASMLWAELPSADAAVALFRDRISAQDAEAIRRVARGESLLVRMTAPGPIGWAKRPIITCEGRGDGGVHLLLADLDHAAATPQGVVANCEVTRASRPSGPELWLIEACSPPCSARAPSTPVH